MEPNTWKDRVEWWQQPVPDAVPGAATAMTSDAATLNATVNPRGAATTYRFEYGKTAAYGTAVPVPNASAGSGTVDVAVSRQISGLEPGTFYHFRVVATSPQGTTYSADKGFWSKTVAQQLAAMTITEPFNGTAESQARFASEWSALGWAGGTTPKGGADAFGWRPLNAYPTVNGAFYNPVVSDGCRGRAARSPARSGGLNRPL